MIVTVLSDLRIHMQYANIFVLNNNNKHCIFVSELYTFKQVVLIVFFLSSR